MLVSRRYLVVTCQAQSLCEDEKVKGLAGHGTILLYSLISCDLKYEVLSCNDNAYILMFAW